ncbi:zinc finger protein 687 [Gastrophryne carolinensis]
MGDMKTPDFDDLLAAFDIPDMDANEAIQSGQEDGDGQAKAAVEVVADHGLPHADITTVSVIVKNTVCPEQVDLIDLHGKDVPALGPRLLQNGFTNPDVSRSAAAQAPNGAEGWVPRVKTKPIDLFTDFAPVENPIDGHVSDLIDRPRDHKLKERPLFESPDPLPPPGGLPTEVGHRVLPNPFSISKITSPGGPLGLGLSVHSIKEEPMEEAPLSPPRPRESALERLQHVAVQYQAGEPPLSPWTTNEQKPDVANRLAMTASPPREAATKSATNPTVPPPPPAEFTEAKTSPMADVPGMKEEPCWSPKSLVSDMDEDDGISSPSSNSSRPLKVRIKTIKTQSGSITRTVTAVSSDSDTAASAQVSEDSSQPPISESSQETPQAATALKLDPKIQSPPKSNLQSPTKVEISPVVKLPLGNGVKFQGPLLPVSTIQNASSVMLMAASVAQQKAVVMPPKANKVVAKNIIHLVQQPLPTSIPITNLTLTNQVTSPTVVTSTASPQRNATVVMVQSQKQPPAVAGTVISRTQSSLVESFNKILNSKNLLPTYKPNLTPPADSSLSLPTFGFRCLECGDSFALEKSLARHYDRRSMRIEVTCNHCTKRLVFFNKCSLLLHARKHKDNGLVMQCSHLVMRPIGLEQMIGQQDMAQLVSVSVVTPAKSSTPGPAQDGAAAAATASPAGDSAILPDQSTYSTFRCLECKEQCKNKAGLALHFQQVSPTATSGSTVCSLCPMMMPNRCSFEAHQRMHKQTPPNVCPECGGNFRMETFQTHLKESCLHFSRRIGYRCQSCSVVFGGVNSIKSHIQTTHCEVFHKCPICPMAFKSAPSAHGHIYTQHPGFSNQQAKMIYKCAMCDTVFTHKPLLCSHLDHAHFDQQLGNQRVSVFKCPECPLLFAQKRTMLEHLKTTHNSVVKEDPPQTPEPVTPKQEPVEVPVSRPADSGAEPEAEPEVEESSSSDSPSSADEKNDKKAKTKDPQKPERPRQRSNCWTCGICHSWFPERDEYVVHMKREHGKSVKKFPCRLCDRSFCSAPSLRRHVRVNHEGIKRVYPCRYCTEGKRTFSSRLILEKHIQVRHGIKVTDQTRSEEVLVARSVSRTQAALRKRKLSSDDSASDPEPAKGDPEPPKADPEPAKAKRAFQCRVCGYKAADQTDFRQHIPQHRTDESAHQCRDCGMCFTSQSSLSRHRFMSHKVKGREGADDGEEPPQRAPASAADGKLTCQVCKKSFDSQLNLNTHFRTHGMAFIKQRQSGTTDN